MGKLFCLWEFRFLYIFDKINNTHPAFRVPNVRYRDSRRKSRGPNYTTTIIRLKKAGETWKRNVRLFMGFGYLPLCHSNQVPLHDSRPISCQYTPCICCCSLICRSSCYTYPLHPFFALSPVVSLFPLSSSFPFCRYWGAGWGILAASAIDFICLFRPDP